MLKTNYLMPVDEDYFKRLEEWLIELARGAVKSARRGKIGSGKGVAQIGFNRRVCWADGTHTMHGGTIRSDFAGLEGPDDPQDLALFAADPNGKVVWWCTTTPPTPQCFTARAFSRLIFPG